MDTFSLPLKNLTDTQLLGRTLALGIQQGEITIILFKGDLGAGKTTLVRETMKHLPGGIEAEVSSPSFTLMNSYATVPPVKHFDLYRLEPFIYDENLDEALDDVDNVVFIEWAERIPEEYLPPEFLQCAFTQSSDGYRTVTFTAQGQHSMNALQGIARRYAHSHV